MSLQSGEGRSLASDPQLTLNNLPIPPVADEPIKFLGMPLSSTFDDNHHKQHLVCKLESLMTKVDRSFLSRKQKLKVFSLGVCPRLAWDLMVIQIPITWIERQLDPLATSYLKRWSGLARCANTSLLYLSQSHGSLHLPSLSTTFKKLHVSRMAQLLVSRDGCVRFVAIRLLQQEGDTSGRAFLPASVVNSIMVTCGCISRRNSRGYPPAAYQKVMNLIGYNISNLSKSKENASGWKWIHLTFGPLQSILSVMPL